MQPGLIRQAGRDLDGEAVEAASELDQDTLDGAFRPQPLLLVRPGVFRAVGSSRPSSARCCHPCVSAAGPCRPHWPPRPGGSRRVPTAGSAAGSATRARPRPRVFRSACRRRGSSSTAASPSASRREARPASQRRAGHRSRTRHAEHVDVSACRRSLHPTTISREEARGLVDRDSPAGSAFPHAGQGGSPRRPPEVGGLAHLRLGVELRKERAQTGPRGCSRGSPAPVRGSRSARRAAEPAARPWFRDATRSSWRVAS